MNLVNFTWHLIGVFLWKHTWPFLRLKLYLNFVSSSNVFNLHEAYMINVHASNNDVIAISHWSNNHKVIFIVLKLNVLCSKSLKLKFVSFKTFLHCCVHPKLILIRKCICGSNWRMMRHLFWDVFPSVSSHFKSFSKDWIERLCHSGLSTSVLRNWKCSNIRHSKDRILDFSSFF